MIIRLLILIFISLFLSYTYFYSFMHIYEWILKNKPTLNILYLFFISSIFLGFYTTITCDIKYLICIFICGIISFKNIDK